MHWFAKDWEDYLWNKILIPKLSILMLTIPPVAGSRKEKRALLGLDEHHYQNIIEIAERSIDERYSSLYISALKIIIRHKPGDARTILFSAICHSSIFIAKAAVRIFFRQKIYLTFAELQICLKKSPSIAHVSLYYSLARKINEWGYIYTR